MFNKLFQLIEHGNEFSLMKEVISTIENLIDHFEDDRLKEDSYAAAIDAVIEILEEYKQNYLKDQGK